MRPIRYSANYHPLTREKIEDLAMREIDAEWATNAELIAKATATKPLLSTDPAERKAAPIARGVLDYFPLAIAEVARISKIGNEQHNPGEELHWAKEKSTDEADCIVRHLIERGGIDTDGCRHSGKLAWRALALLQRELEAAK